MSKRVLNSISSDIKVGPSSDIYKMTNRIDLLVIFR